MEDIFFDSKLKLSRADEHVTSLKEALQLYGKEAKFSLNPIENQNQFSIFQIQPDLTKMFSLIVGDVIHNLRAALDIMICSIAKKRDLKNWHKFDIPFTKNLSEFNEKVKKSPYKDLGDDLIQVMRELKPFEYDGNSDLYALHRLDIADKHRLILPTVSAVFGAIDNQRFLKDAGLNVNVVKISDGSDEVQIKSGDRVPHDFTQRYLQIDDKNVVLKFSSEVDFFKNEDVVKILCRLGGLVRKIGEEFEEKFK